MTLWNIIFFALISSIYIINGWFQLTQSSKSPLFVAFVTVQPGIANGQLLRNKWYTPRFQRKRSLKAESVAMHCICADLMTYAWGVSKRIDMHVFMIIYVYHPFYSMHVDALFSCPSTTWQCNGTFASNCEPAHDSFNRIEFWLQIPQNPASLRMYTAIKVRYFEIFQRLVVASPPPLVLSCTSLHQDLQRYFTSC